ncbi:MAG: FAD:protein transferase [Actinomycetota bacterium]|nr:FAD:protein transferase [Actinomycetota bacterium]
MGIAMVRPLRRTEAQWGTVITVDVRDPIDDAAVDACFDWFRQVDDLFSTWRSDTEIMQIGRGELSVEDANPLVREVLALSEQMRLESNGVFDITFGARAGVASRPGFAPIDPSGIVKGWAVARAGDLLRAAGASCFFVNAGGDVITGGHPSDSQAAWRVGIQHPWERDRVAAVVAVADAAVATSGRYERGDHVVDPRSGLPAKDLASVTVIGPDLAVADAYATAAIALGPAQGMRWLATRAGYEGMAITDNRAVLFTSGFDRYRVS